MSEMFKQRRPAACFYFYFFPQLYLAYISFLPLFSLIINMFIYLRASFLFSYLKKKVILENQTVAMVMYMIDVH